MRLEPIDFPLGSLDGPGVVPETILPERLALLLPEHLPRARPRRLRGTNPPRALANGGAGERRDAPDRAYGCPPPRGGRGAECRGHRV